MVEMSHDEKLQKEALFDFDKKDQYEDLASYKQEQAQWAEKEAAHQKDREADYSKKYSQLKEATSAIDYIKSTLEWVKKADPKLAAQTETYLASMMNTDLSMPSAAKKLSEKAVDLDGSKQSLWGKLKNKAKNFIKPNNAKATLEAQIGKLKEQMAANPETFEWLKQCSRPEGKSYDNKERVSFAQLTETRGSILQNYNHERVSAMRAKEDALKYQQTTMQDSQSYQSDANKMQEFRNNAAKEIELRSEARETTGIKDINANTGVDRLADKAKAMEGMTPEQRLAYRMEQLRGTAKTEAKPVIKREMDSNLKTHALQGKQNA